MRRRFHFGWVFLAALLLGGLSACTTPKPGAEDDPSSDIPWNTPQNWEGTLPMPGMPPN